MSDSPPCAGLVLERHASSDPVEELDRLRLVDLVRTEPDPWSRRLPLHLTASALVVHPPTGMLLLRWHDRLGQWMQVGGHGDPGETDPLAIALREAEEETGLCDLRPFRSAEDAAPELTQAVVVPVPAGGSEPAHEHGDLRYVLVTGRPGLAKPESPGAELRWVTFDEASGEVGSANLLGLIDRARKTIGC